MWLYVASRGLTSFVAHDLDTSLTGCCVAAAKDRSTNKPSTHQMSQSNLAWVSLIAIDRSNISKLLVSEPSRRQSEMSRQQDQQTSRYMTPFIPPLAYFIVLSSPIVYLPHSSKPAERRHIPPGKNKHQSLVSFPPFYP